MNYSDRVNIAEYIDSDMTEGEKHFRGFITAVISDKEQPAPETMLFLAKAFKEILQGNDADKALMLTTKQGTKKTDKKTAAKNKNIKIAVMVEERILQGATKDEAREIVRKLIKKSYRIVRTHHKENELIAKEMIKTFQKFDELKKQRNIKDKK